MKELIEEETLTLASRVDEILCWIKLVALLQLVSLSDENTGDWIGDFSFRQK